MDTITGTGDDDRIDGSNFDDSILGAGGADILAGGSGDDILEGGTGADLLIGGKGHDQFVVSAVDEAFDRVEDLEPAELVVLPLASGDVRTVVVETGDRFALPRDGEVLLTWMPDLGLTRVRIGGQVGGASQHGVDLAGEFHAADFVVVPGSSTEAVLAYIPFAFEGAGTEAADFLFGGNRGDTLRGAGGDDVLLGYGGNDLLDGGAGDDIFASQAGNDALLGGAGIDTVLYEVLEDEVSGGISANLQAGRVVKPNGTDVVSGIERIFGTRFGDTIVGSDGDDTLVGQSTLFLQVGSRYDGAPAAGDVIAGGAGADAIQGGAGDDTLYGGSAGQAASAVGDTFWFADRGNGIDEIRDFNSTELIAVATLVPLAGVTAGNGSALAAGGVQVQASAGLTTLFIDTDGVSGADVVIRLAGQFDAALFNATVKAGSVLTLWYGVLLGDGDDAVVLTSGADNANGRAGNDSISGLAGDDTLQGDSGDDTIDGGAGNDVLDGGTNGAGGDWLLFSQATGGVSVDLARGLVAQDGQGGHDTVSGIENVQGTAFGDTLVGDAGSSRLVGGSGNDWLAGENPDLFTYSPGVDTLDGGAGDDTLVASDGLDVLVGGEGTDTVVLANYRLSIDLSRGIVRSWDGQATVTGVENVTSVAGNIVTGSLGANVLRGGSSQDWIHGQPFEAGTFRYIGVATGGDLIVGGGFSDEIQGGTGDDTLWGGDFEAGVDDGWGDHFLFADRGNGRDLIADLSRLDSIQVSTSFTEWAPLSVARGDGSTVTNGGMQVSSAGGRTTLFIDTDGVMGADVTIDLVGTFDALDFDGYRGNGRQTSIVLSPRTGPGNDSVRLLSTDDYLHGFAGNDVLEGYGGNDSLFGDAGDDSLVGGDGNDRLDGGDGNDTIVGSAGNDVLDGGGNDAGGDWLAFGDSTTGVSVNLAAGLVSRDGLGGQDTISGFENIRDSWYSDTLVGDAGANVFTRAHATWCCRVSSTLRRSLSDR